MSWENLQREYPWPDCQPDIKPTRHGWAVHERTWFDLLSNLEQPIVAEVGAWCGKTSYWLLERFFRLRLIAIDSWALDATNFSRTYRDRWAAQGRMRPTDSLVDLYRANLWDFRDRVVMIQADSVDGMRHIIDEEVRPGVVYIDASHDHESVTSDVNAAIELFPRAIICGDDYKRGGPVATAVHEIADERGFRVQLLGNTRFWRYGGCPLH